MRALFFSSAVSSSFFFIVPRVRSRCGRPGMSWNPAMVGRKEGWCTAEEPGRLLTLWKSEREERKRGQ